MTVLITAASKHGSTTGIAKTLQSCLERAGIHTIRMPPDEVDSIKPYDAVILGSAVYGGSWMKEALDFAETFEADLLKKPIWLFSSGPVSEPLKPAEDVAVKLTYILTLAGARDHKLFAGKIERKQLNFAEKAVTYALGVKEGDYRDWKAIEDWGNEIAKQLTKMPLHRQWLGAIVK